MGDTRRQIEEAKRQGVEINAAFLPIPREMIEDESKAKDLARRVRDFLRNVVPVEQYTHWSFEGYNLDPRELFQIEAVRKFMCYVFDSDPTALRKLAIDSRMLTRSCYCEVPEVHPITQKTALFIVDETPEWWTISDTAGIDRTSCVDLPSATKKPRR